MRMKLFNFPFLFPFYIDICFAICLLMKKKTLQPFTRKDNKITFMKKKKFKLVTSLEEAKKKYFLPRVDPSSDLNQYQQNSKFDRSKQTSIEYQLALRPRSKSKPDEHIIFPTQQIKHHSPKNVLETAFSSDKEKLLSLKSSLLLHRRPQRIPSYFDLNFQKPRRSYSEKNLILPLKKASENDYYKMETLKKLNSDSNSYSKLAKQIQHLQSQKKMNKLLYIANLQKIVRLKMELQEEQQRSAHISFLSQMQIKQANEYWENYVRNSQRKSELSDEVWTSGSLENEAESEYYR